MGDRRQKNQHRLPVDPGGQSEAHSRKTVRDSVSNQVKVRVDSSDFPLTSTCVPHIYISCTQAKRGKVTHALYTHPEETDKTTPLGGAMVHSMHL